MEDSKFAHAPGHKWLGVLRVVLAPLLFVLGPVRSSGSSNVPMEGGLIVLANHLSDADPILVQYCCPRPIYFMSKSELLLMKVVGPFLLWWGGFGVNRGEPDRKALKHAIELAKAGNAVGVFPEGQLAEDGKLQELKPGVGLIIRSAGVPVICCGLKNPQHIIPYGSVIPRPAFRRVTVTWGEPRTFSKENENDEIMAWVESEFRRLIPEPKQ